MEYRDFIEMWSGISHQITNDRLYILYNNILEEGVIIDYIISLGEEGEKFTEVVEKNDQAVADLYGYKYCQIWSY